MDPSQDSKRCYDMKATTPYHQQGASTSTTAEDLVPLRMQSSNKPENSNSPGVSASVSPMVSGSVRQLPVGTHSAVQSFLYNTSNSMGYPNNIPLVAGPNNMSSVSDLTNQFVQNSQRQTLDNLQPANLLSLLGGQFPSFSTRATAPFPGFPSIGTSTQLVQTSNAPLLMTLMQQMLCGSMNASAAPLALPPINNSNLVGQLMAQLLNAQLVQSAQPGPLAGLLQLVQAISSMTNSASAAAPSQTSILSQLSSLDSSTAKQVILLLVNQLIQSGNLTSDETCHRFVEKLLSSSTWQPTQSVATNDWQTVPNMSTLNSASSIAPENIKTEMMVSVSISASTSPESACDGIGVTPACDADRSTYGIKVETAPEESDAEMSCGESAGNETQQLNSSLGNSTKPVKNRRKCASKELVALSTKRNSAGKFISKHSSKEVEKGDLSESSEPSDEQQTSGKRLRSRNKTVKYCEDELADELEQDDEDADISSKKRKSDSRARSNSKNSVSKETKTNRTVSSGVTESRSSLTEVAASRNASNSQAVVKSEITGTISLLPKINTCHSPNVRYLFMGRKNDGMDWLNLVSYKITGSDDTMNQCLFCPMISTDVKPVADHIANEHGDLDFVMTNIKQPNGRVIYLACRHCNFVTFEPTLMWIHFELYHGIPGIMDGSSLPRIQISDPVNVEEISLDEQVNSSHPAYVCLDCLLCSSNSKSIAMHVVQAHPDTVNFNGCFVKLMMIKTKDKGFTFREALHEESHAEALKDVYVCMLCEYSTHGAYLAMSHSLRLHQTKRLVLICNECEYQCTRETNLMMHMSSSHNCPSTTSFLCSVTLIAALSNGTFIECEFPEKSQRMSDHSSSSSNCDVKSSSILQSTAVSSSEEKRKSDTLIESEGAAVAPQNDDKTVLLGKNIDSN